MFYWFVKSLFWPWARLYFRISVTGKENIPGRGAALIAANHSSFLDPPCLGSASPRKIHFVIKRSVYEKFMQRWFYTNMETIPVREAEADLDAVKRVIRILKDGGVVGIFPQGAVSSEDDELTWLDGASFFAAKTGCPTIPCAIIGTARALGKGMIFPRPLKIDVVFGKPLIFPGTIGGKINKEDRIVFTNTLFRRINELRKGEPFECWEETV